MYLSLNVGVIPRVEIWPKFVDKDNFLRPALAVLEVHALFVVLAFPTVDRQSTSDLQKSRHLQKSRFTERHNRGTKRKLKSRQGRKNTLRAFFGPGVATSIFALCSDCAAP